MIKKVFLILSVFVNFILQTTILPHIAVLGIIPNTTAAITVLAGFFSGAWWGAGVGLVSGLLQDIMFGKLIGINALIYFIIGYLAGLVGSKTLKIKLYMIIITIIITTIIYNLFYGGFLVFLGIETPLFRYLKDKLIIKMLTNSIYIIPLYYLYSFIFKEKKLNFGD